MTLPAAMHGKISLLYYSPYKVTAMINEVTYRLKLSATTHIHDVFHVGLLKKFIGTPPGSPLPLPLDPPWYHPTTTGSSIEGPPGPRCSPASYSVGVST